MTRKKIILLVVILVILLVAIAAFAKGKIDKEFYELLGKVKREDKGCVEAGKSLENVKVDPHFDATHFAYMLHEAKGFFNDNEDDVWYVLSGKTLPELKAIDTTFQNRYGMKVVDYLKTFLSESEMKRVDTIFKSAPQ